LSFSLGMIIAILAVSFSGQLVHSFMEIKDLLA